MTRLIICKVSLARIAPYLLKPVRNVKFLMNAYNAKMITISWKKDYVRLALRLILSAKLVQEEINV